MSDLAITPLRPDDLNFVLHSWKKTFHFATRDQIPASAFFPWHSQRITKILNRDPLALAARDSENPLYLYGYLIAERIGPTFALHWVQVKKPYWRQGIASHLLAEALKRIGEGASELIYTHRIEKLERKAAELGFEFLSVERLYAAKEAA